MSVRSARNVWCTGNQITFGIGADYLGYKMYTLTLRNFNTGYSGGRASLAVDLKPLLF